MLICITAIPTIDNYESESAQLRSISRTNGTKSDGCNNAKERLVVAKKNLLCLFT